MNQAEFKEQNINDYLSKVEAMAKQLSALTGTLNELQKAGKEYLTPEQLAEVSNVKNTAEYKEAIKGLNNVSELLKKTTI